jgi:hypothetical protein
VAVKVVPVGHADEASSLVREFGVLSRVDVEGLVGFHEAVGLAGEPAAVALVLDHVQGGSLEGILGARGHLSAGESVTMLSPVARALAGLHALGVVHGDVTPANVLVDRTGRPLLADLGVASLAGEVPGERWGTDGFVAPEVLDRGVVTPASDVYAVGALAWWCVTGSPPGPVALRRPLDELAPGLPLAWSEITLRALRGDPGARPTAAELALAYYDSAPCEPLRLVVGSDETSLRTQRLRSATPPISRTAGDRAPRGRDPRRLWALGTLVLLVVGLGCGGLMASGRLASPGWVHRQADAVGRPSPARVMLPVSAPGPTHAPSQPSVGLPAAATDLATDHGAPQRDPRGLMAALGALRAEVMMARSATALARLDVAGSAAFNQDAAMLHDLDASRQSWQAVELTVTSARTITHTATTASVAALVGTAAYRVVDASGRTQPRPAVQGQELVYELRWVAGRWRVDSIAAGTP